MKNPGLLSVFAAVALLVIPRSLPAQTGFAPTSAPSGIENTATGKSALSSNTTGNFNAATGGYALEKNVSGSQNTATGFYALGGNTTGSDNTADGYTALNFNTTGYANAATGSYALEANTTGYANTAAGSYALTANTTGTSNTACGNKALFTNKSGTQNTAEGFYALYLSTGSHNTAVGTRALNYLSTGEENVALGFEAGYSVTTGSNNIEIGSQGDKADSETLRIGTQGTQKQAFVAGIFGATAAGGVPVVVTASGQLGTVTSSAKFKRDIRDMGHASDALMALRPVTFEYKPEIDPAGTPQFGLIAEEVEKIDPDLVVRDADHHIYSVRYDAVNAMLLNEVQKEHQTIAAQQKMLEKLSARLDALEESKK
jgi:hypothetical protein